MEHYLKVSKPTNNKQVYYQKNEAVCRLFSSQHDWC